MMIKSGSAGALGRASLLLLLLYNLTAQSALGFSWRNKFGHQPEQDGADARNWAILALPVPQPVGAGADAHMDDSALGDFISRESKELLGDACPRLQELDSYMDGLAIKVNEATGRQGGAELRAELAREIHLDELASEQWKESASNELQAAPCAPGTVCKFTRRNSKGLVDVLEEEEEDSDYIVEQERKISLAALDDLIQFGQRGPSLKKRMKFIEDYERSLAHQAEPILQPSSVRVGLLQRLKASGSALMKVASAAVFLADQFYASADFLERLPVIGGTIEQWKMKFKTAYDIMQQVRSIHALFVMQRIEGKVESEVQTGVRLLSNAGLAAISELAGRLAESHTGIDLAGGNIDEIKRRCAFYLLSKFAPQTAQLACSRQQR